MTEQSSVSRRNPIQTGERHGRLVAVKRVGQDRWKAALWQFRCDCGNKNYVARPDQVRRGIILSCSCLRAEESAKRARSRTKHGHSRGGTLTSEYNSWRNMLGRCYDPTNPNYPRYGARGIIVCERWRQSFLDFLADMGAKPNTSYTINRHNNDGNYEPGNCRWASKRTQNRNMSTNVLVEFDGERMCLQDACDRAGILRNVVEARLRRGWTMEKALSTPVKYHKPRVRQS